MLVLRWIIIALSLLQGCWMLFDGTRALTVGDYVTPRSGPSAGELGPWSKVVALFGLEPRSVAVKASHVVLGAAWILAVLCFAFAISAGWTLQLICAICSLYPNSNSEFCICLLRLATV